MQCTHGLLSRQRNFSHSEFWCEGLRSRYTTSIHQLSHRSVLCCVFLRVMVVSPVAVTRFCGAEFNRPDPPAQVLLAGDPDAGPDVEVRGPSWKTDLLTRLQTQQVNFFFLCTFFFFFYASPYYSLLPTIYWRVAACLP